MRKKFSFGNISSTEEMDCLVMIVPVAGNNLDVIPDTLNKQNIAQGNFCHFAITPKNDITGGPVFYFVLLHSSCKQLRLLAPGLANGTAPVPSPPYSIVPGSALYQMVRDVYDKSLAITANQIVMAIYHSDAPGYTEGGQLVAFLSQVFTKANATLDIAELAFANAGPNQHEASAICFSNKYKYNC